MGRRHPTNDKLSLDIILRPPQLISGNDVCPHLLQPVRIQAYILGQLFLCWIRPICTEAHWHEKLYVILYVIPSPDIPIISIKQANPNSRLFAEIFGVRSRPQDLLPTSVYAIHYLKVVASGARPHFGASTQWKAYLIAVLTAIYCLGLDWPPLTVSPKFPLVLSRLRWSSRCSPIIDSRGPYLKALGSTCLYNRTRFRYRERKKEIAEPAGPVGV